jgi:hypothetical protein
MFYNAMRCSGVGLVKAKTMFFAVWARGPRWTTLNSTMPAQCKLNPPIDAELQAKVAHAIQARPLSMAETKAVARPFFSVRAMSDAEAAKFVADLKQRTLNPKETYAVAFSVIQSSQFSDAVKKTKSWIGKENPSLKAIEERAEQTRKASQGVGKGQGFPQIPNGEPFFSDVPEIRAQSLEGSR